MKRGVALFLLCFSFLCGVSNLSLAQEDFLVPDDPKAVMRDYLTALNKGRVNPSFYNKSSQTIAHARNTPDQMEAEAQVLKACGAGESKIEGDYAVIRYPGKDTCPPYFLSLEKIAWKIDLNVMTMAIATTNEGKWHFVGDPHSLPFYGFAFNDWAFDQDGYVMK
jgi:hypothetical protein